MERSNQPPKPEGCLQPGPEPESLGTTVPNDLREAYTGQSRGPQAGFASGLSNSASKCLAADGDGLGSRVPIHLDIWSKALVPLAIIHVFGFKTELQFENFLRIADTWRHESIEVGEERCDACGV